MATLLEQLSYMNDSKELIRQAIINKGVEVPASTTLRKYSDKIDAIQAEFPAEWTVNSNGALTSVILKDTVTFPTEVDGSPTSTTFSMPGNFHEVFAAVKRLVWPEHFLNVNLGYAISGSAEYSQFSKVEEIECNATVITGDAYAVGALRYLKKFSAPKLVGNIGFDFLSRKNPVNNTLTIDIPEAAGTFDSSSIGNATNIVELKVNAPKITSVGTAHSTQNALFQYCTGDWTFPSATTFGYHKIPNMEQTLRLPSITTQNYSFAFSTGGSGMLHLYIGPNMSRCDCATNWVTNAAHIDIHIPAGDTTTKATLDAAGVAYTQDYVI